MTAPQPAADASPLLYLVQQYGNTLKRVGELRQRQSDGRADQRQEEADVLFARIEAEVQQLHGGLKGYGRALDEISAILGHTGPVVPDPVAEVQALCDRYADAQRDLTRALQARGEFLDEANRLRARIAALVPVLPVQARNGAGLPWWQHECGTVAAYPTTLPEAGCVVCNHASGPWRPLLVGGDPAPEPRCSACGSVNPPGGCNIHCPTIVIAQVMATLGVDRPEDVPRAVKDLWADHLLVENASRRAVEWMQQRDEARAEVERLTATLEASLGRCRCRICHELPELSEASPPAQPDPLVLRLPEVPEGAVALVGVRSGRRYPFHEESGGWRNDDGEGAPWKLSAVLHREQPEGVRVEIVPPREPRTAAEIWRAFSNDDRRRLVNTAELAEALDREAGLNMDGGQS